MYKATIYAVLIKSVYLNIVIINNNNIKYRKGNITLKVIVER